MKDIYLYLCDSRRAIADGRCKGTMCTDVDGYSCCHHTTDVKYAKYQKPFKDRMFDAIRLEDSTGVSEVLTYWEVDPQELS